LAKRPSPSPARASFRGSAWRRLLGPDGLFETKDPGWFKSAFSVTGGYVLASLDKRMPAEASLWDKEKDRWVATLTQSKQADLFKAYIQAVQQSAKVVMVNESILGAGAKTPLPATKGGK